jgi:hypothetical protein
MKGHQFAVIATVENPVKVSAVFPSYLSLSDGDGRCSWEFFVRIDLCETDGWARIDFLKIDSEGEFEFQTEHRPLLRTGEFFRPGNNYEKISAAEFNAKITDLRAALDAVPRE